MRKSIILIISLVATLSLPGCSDFAKERYEQTGSLSVYCPQNKVFETDFVVVPEDAFTLYETPSGRLIDGAAAPRATVTGLFYISSRPVGKTVYEHYMGVGRWPRNGLSVEQFEKFLDVLYNKTGIPFVMPSEAMIQAALLSESITPDEKDEIPCSSKWTEDTLHENTLLMNPRGSAPGGMHVLRSMYGRKPIESYRQRRQNRFYIAVNPADGQTFYEMSDLFLFSSQDPWQDVFGEKSVVRCQGVDFRMLPVRGGTLRLGATDEQRKYAEGDEGPEREVELSDFMLLEHEVTVAQWQAVMGTLPYGNNRWNGDVPVVNVSWYDAQRFCFKLSMATGLHFRLPSEDEWEYAARGGMKSHGYIFSGGNNAPDYAVCSKRVKDDKTLCPPLAVVRSKKANELGLYDMSGNVWEWVRGSYAADDDTMAVMRGGSRKSINTSCRVSNRQAASPYARKDTFGFRIAL